MPTINWKAVVSASLLAGLAFLVLDLALVAIVGGESLWGPPRMIGAILLGEGVLPPPATFHLDSFLAALVVHVGLSLIYGSIFAWVANRAGWSLSASALIGVLFGLAIYSVNFYGMTAFFPWQQEYIPHQMRGRYAGYSSIIVSLAGLVAAAVAVAYALVLGLFIYRDLSPAALPKIILETVETTGVDWGPAPR